MSGPLPHLADFMWTPSPLSLGLAADTLIGITYAVTALALAIWAFRQSHRAPRAAVWLLLAFVLAGAASHLAEPGMEPGRHEALAGALKAIAVITSVAVVIALRPRMTGWLAREAAEDGDLARNIEVERQRRIQAEQRFRALHARFKSEVRDRTAALEEQARTDDLSGLYNRRHLHERLDEELLRARRRNEPRPSVILIDLDNFKEVNDRYGHTMGDMVIARMGTILKETVRGADVAARYGGDEFCVLATGARATQPWALAQRLQARVRAELRQGPAGQPLGVSCSVGVIDASVEVRDARQLLELVDRALYQAKRQGKDRLARVGPEALLASSEAQR